MIRVVVLCLTVLTGFAGLVYEVAWQKLLATLLGADSASTAAVLAFFLGGLAGGYAIFGALSRRVVARAAVAGRPARLLALYAVAEAGVGAWAWVFLPLLDALRGVSLALPRPEGALAFAIDAALAALLVAPPAICMGATIPVLTQALSRNLDDATRWHARVYGSNSLGAFIGAIAAGFWIVPAFGLVSTLRAMGALNLAVAAVLLALDRRASRVPDAIATGAAPAPRDGPERGLAGAALLLGFAMMTVQTVLMRLAGLSLGASQFAFSMIVAVFVLAIALGALAVSAARRIPAAAVTAAPWLLLVLLAVLYTELDAAPYAAHVLRSLFRDQSAGFYPYQATVLLALLATVGPVVAVSGAILPLLFHTLRDALGGLGRTAGRLYAWNTLGSLLGALIGGYAALFWLDLHHVFRLALAAVALAAVLVSVRVGGVPRWAGATLAGVAFGAIALLGPWSAERLSSGLFRLREPITATYAGAETFHEIHHADRILFYEDGPVSSIAVKERVYDDGFRDASLVSNGKGDGSLRWDYLTMSLAALVPAILAEDPRRAFVIGWGTGVSTGELASLDSMREIIVAEISPAVLRTAPLFARGNLDAIKSPKVRVVTGDAYRTLLRSPGEFDVVVSEPSNPWVAGVEMLYSREFLEASRDRLAKGGVHAQWMHAYEIDREGLELVLRTYLDVFDEVSVWYGLGVDLLILGRRADAPELDLEQLAERVARPDFAAALSRSGIRGLPGVLAHETLPAGTLREVPFGREVHTLLRPRLGDLAARAFFSGSGAHLPAAAGESAATIGVERSLVQRLVRASGGSLSDVDCEALVRETCRHRSAPCATLFAWWTHLHPDSERRNSLLTSIRTNPRAAGRLRPDRLAALERLYDPDPGPAGGEDPLRRAQRITDLFYGHYLHAAPFPREHLEAVWAACDVDPARSEACSRERKRAEAYLGRLEARPPGPVAPEQLLRRGIEQD